MLAYIPYPNWSFNPKFSDCINDDEMGFVILGSRSNQSPRDQAIAGVSKRVSGSFATRISTAGIGYDVGKRWIQEQATLFAM